MKRISLRSFSLAWIGKGSTLKSGKRVSNMGKLTKDELIVDVREPFKNYLADFFR